MTETLKPDLCIIGGGSAGLTVAAAARAFNASVVLIEKGKMGGDCLNTGCVPSKSLIAAAKHAHVAKTGPAFGISFDEPVVDFGAVKAHIRDVIDGIAPHDSVERFTALGAKVIQAPARFVSKKAVEAGDYRIEAKRFVIATGSRAAVPPIPGLANVPYLTNESIFEVKDKPAHLLIIGGGPIGMEMAQAFVRLGSRVTVLEGATPLSKDDPELTRIVLSRLEQEGVVIRSGVKVVEVTHKKKAMHLTIETGEGARETVIGSHLLVAAGRSANIEDLGLETARVKTEKKLIKVNKHLKTSNGRVYAIGDVNGGLQFTHAAGYEASLVVRNALFGLPAPVNTNIVPWATYTDPELANVGMTEAEANKKYRGKIRVLRFTFAENDRARAERKTEGLVKLITDKKGLILGCGIAGAQAGELISLFAYAIANKQKVSSFLGFIAPYPTLSELAKRVSLTFYNDKLDNPWLKRWMALVRLFR